MNPYIFAGISKNSQLLASDKHMMLTKEVSDIDMDNMLRAACRITNADYEKTINRSRKRECIDAKGIVCFFLRKYTRMTLSSIGKHLKVDHATVMHHCRKFDNMIEINDSIVLEYMRKFKSSNIELINKYKMN